MIPKSIGPIQHFVNDFSGVLSPEVLQSLDTLFQSLERDTTKQIVTIIFPHREGAELIDIGTEIFNTAQIGQKGLNNGLLLLIASDEKKLRIIVGKGLEWIYDEAWCQNIIEEKLHPLLNQHNFSELIEIFHTEIQLKEKNTSVKNNLGTIKSTLLRSRMFHNFPKILGSLFILSSMIGGIAGIFIFLFLPFIFYPFLIEILGFLLFLGILFLLFFCLFLLFRKNKKITRFLIILCVLNIFQVFGSGMIYKQNKECEANPILCEQKRIEAEQKKNVYNSGSSRSYESSSHTTKPSSTYENSSSFDGGGGSTNGAGWGD